jgi:penicillin amidase
MKKEKAFISFTFLVFLIFGLNTRWGIVPPIGKLLDPFKGYIHHAKESVPNGEIHLDGMKEAVKILFDNRIVPHVFASSESDLYFAQGYLHAKDRLFQMDFLSRAASGTLSEVAGIETLDLDRAARRKGLLWAAERSLEYIKKNNPKTLMHFEAYANGVNAFLANLKAEDYPVEFKILNYAPAAWSPLKTVLIQKYMADMLCGTDKDAERTNALSVFGKKDYEELFDEKLTKQCAMVDSFPVRDRKHTLDSGSLTFDFEKTMHIGNKNVKDLFQPKPGYGSNSWAVSGSKTESGYPILANDPHLALMLPSIWYEIQLSQGKDNAYGVSIPGTPYIIAWGITNGETDVKDWYTLKFRNNFSEYYFNEKWLKTDKRIESIPVFSYRQVVDTVLYTVLGPIVFDDNFKPNPEQMNQALKWVAHDPSNDFNTFYLMNKATNYQDYTEALKGFNAPNLNFSFASRTDIAIAHQGKIPLRTKHGGEFILDGSALKSIPDNFIPQESLPHEVNPKRGFVFSANQNPAGDDYAYNLYGSYAVYRNRTIHKVLAAEKKITLKDMMNLQLDNLDLFAAEALPVMLKNVDRSKLGKEEVWFLDSLISWNHCSDTNVVAPLCFYAWWEKFYNATWDEVLLLKYPGAAPSYSSTVDLLAHKPASKYFDVVATPNVEDAPLLLQATLKECCIQFNTAQQKYGKLSWGKNKETSFAHMAHIGGFSCEDVVCGGSQFSVNASTTDWGPGWRMIVAFGKSGPAGWGVLPGGESGNPASRFYGSGISEWAEGKYFKLLFMKNAAEPIEQAGCLIIK